MRRHGSATLGSVHRNSLSLKLAHTLTHTHTPSLPVSLTLTAATTIDADAGAAAAAELFPAFPTLGFNEEFIPLYSVFGSELHIMEKTRGGSIIHLQRCRKEFPWVCSNGAV